MPYARRFYPYRRGDSPGSASSSSSSGSDDEDEPQCSRCGRCGHARADCYARMRANGARLGTPHARARHPPGHARAQRGGVRPAERRAPSVRRKSQSVAQRVQAHRAGDGTRFLEVSAPQRQLQVLTRGTPEDLEMWERNETLAQMHAHGVDNVRGWIFTGATLTPPERASAVAQV